jgi:hypothetical protein
MQNSIKKTNRGMVSKIDMDAAAEEVMYLNYLIFLQFIIFQQFFQIYLPKHSSQKIPIIIIMFPIN